MGGVLTVQTEGPESDPQHPYKKAEHDGMCLGPHCLLCSTEMMDEGQIPTVT